MGMFDYVRYEAPCWKCGTTLTDFQSKDGNCYMETVRPEEVQTFYSDCPKCKVWNEYITVPLTWKIIPHDERDAGNTCPHCQRPYSQ
jgi:hypothetical protein